ncbi:MAG: HNH endonuclease [Candidatus Edwardsbacteria bacterium]
MLDRHVLVLNQNYEPLSICKAKRAIVLVYLGKAEIVERDGRLIHSVSGSFPLPSVVRLSFYVKTPKKDINLTRQNIIKRDQHTCQYCGTTKGPLTTDHIIPKSQGGEDSWENLVCACIKCNNKKGDRNPKEAKMPLYRRPKKPHYLTFIHCFITAPDSHWKPYLFLE